LKKKEEKEKGEGSYPCTSSVQKKKTLKVNAREGDGLRRKKGVESRSIRKSANCRGAQKESETIFGAGWENADYYTCRRKKKGNTEATT